MLSTSSSRSCAVGSCASANRPTRPWFVLFFATFDYVSECVWLMVEQHVHFLRVHQAHSLVMSITRRARLLRGEELGHANIFPQMPPEPEVPRNICR